MRCHDEGQDAAEQWDGDILGTVHDSTLRCGEARRLPAFVHAAMLMHFGVNVADRGFVDLAPEFWPDLRRKLHWRNRSGIRGSSLKESEHRSVDGLSLQPSHSDENKQANTGG